MPEVQIMVFYVLLASWLQVVLLKALFIISDNRQTRTILFPIENSMQAAWSADHMGALKYLHKHQHTNTNTNS